MCHDVSDTCVDYIRANETVKKDKMGKMQKEGGKTKNTRQRVDNIERIRKQKNKEWKKWYMQSAEGRIVDEKRKNKKGNF